MKKTIRTTIIATLLVGLMSTPMHADDEAVAAIGGFVLGMITGAVIENNNHDVYYGAEVEISHDRHADYEHRNHRRNNRHDRYAKRSRCGKHDRYDCNACPSKHHGPKGRWETKRLRVWVPGHWNLVVNNCGDRVRIWKSGHYTYRSERVWVSSRQNYRHSRCG